MSSILIAGSDNLYPITCYYPLFIDKIPLMVEVQPQPKEAARIFSLKDWAGIRHPGFSMRNPDGRVVPTSFEPFTDFVAELDPSIDRDAFIGFLRDLFSKTRGSWCPGLCADSLKIAPEARKILPQYFSGGAEVEIMITPEHLWCLLHVGNEYLVVDPAGVYDPDLGKIIPYFGSETNCMLYGTHLFKSELIYGSGTPYSLGEEEAAREMLAEYKTIQKLK